MILVRHGESEFNVHFSVTRIDPGIEDPGLTDEGQRQAEAAAKALAATGGIERIITSPYWRTLHTAEIIADRLDLPVTIEPLVRERAYFACDIGSPRSRLSARWPDFHFGDLAERWWPEPTETEAELAARCGAFGAAQQQDEAWQGLLVVSHWGFILGLTGEAVGNCEMLRFDPRNGRINKNLP